MIIRQITLFVLLNFLLNFSLIAQDTFSIVAVDPETGEVGSAGASCVDLSQFPGFSPDFLADLIPGEGAINTQAFWNNINQNNALQQFQNGNSPQEIIDWLIDNDISNQPEIRQYGIIKLLNDSIYGAAHTGADAPQPANQIIGEDFVVVANFMATSSMADSMALAFSQTEGALSCKLLAALQAGKRQGGDSRCTPSGISSLFAFVKTATTDANFNEPSFLLSVQTQFGEGIDAIDSLQQLFDTEANCGISTSIEEPETLTEILIYPNPTTEIIHIKHPYSKGNIIGRILDTNGKQMLAFNFSENVQLQIGHLPSGIYILHLPEYGLNRRIVIQD